MTANNDLYNKSSGPSHQHPDVNVCVRVCYNFCVFYGISFDGIESMSHRQNHKTNEFNFLLVLVCHGMCVFVCCKQLDLIWSIIYNLYERRVKCNEYILSGERLLSVCVFQNQIEFHQCLYHLTLSVGDIELHTSSCHYTQIMTNFSFVLIMYSFV